MNEKAIEKELWFLVEKYGLSYFREEFRTDWYCTTTAYSFCNKYGCFTISYSEELRKSYFMRFDKVSSVKDWVFSNNSDEFRKAEIEPCSVETEIWNKHRGSLLFKEFWPYGKRFFRAMAEVIEHQIETTGQFFGIKVVK